MDIIDNKIQHSATYRTKHFIPLMALCQKITLNDEYLSTYKYFKFHLEKNDSFINEDVQDNIINYYYFLFLYIISSNEPNKLFCNTIYRLPNIY